MSEPSTRTRRTLKADAEGLAPPDSHQCGSLKRRMPERCTLPAGWGTDHVGIGACRKHGGTARSHRVRAQRIQLERAVVTYGARREIGHLEAMVELLHDSAGHVAWLRDIIAVQAPEALVWGLADELTKGSGEFPGIDVRKAAAPSVWLNEYHRERRILLDVSKELAKLELDWDAREAIRRQGAALARVVRETVRQLGHDPNDPAVARAFMSALRTVLGAGVDVDRVLEGRLA